MNDDFHKWRELTRDINRFTLVLEKVPSDGELKEQLEALETGSALIYEIGPVESEWGTAEWLFENPNHPFSLRFVRQRAACWFRAVALNYPSVITSGTLARLHVALFDVCAAVSEDVSITLGLLCRPESREPLERLSALICEFYGPNYSPRYCQWSLLRLADHSCVEPEQGTDDARVLIAKKIGPEIVHLVSRGESLLLRNKDTGAEVGVSQLEAHIFYNASESRLAEFFPGIDSFNGEGSVSRLGAVATGFLGGLPLHDQLVTLTDSTTISMSSFAVEGLLRPESLLDLSTLVHCCVFYDFVLVDAEKINAPDELKSIILAARPYETSEVEPRWETAVQLETELSNDPMFREELEQAWEDMLGTPASIDFRSFDSITDSPGITQYFPGNNFGFFDPLDALSRPDASGNSQRELTRAVSIQSFRYWINEKVAESLGVAYNCTTLRYPVENIALARRSKYLTTVGQLIARIAPEQGELVKKPHGAGHLDPVRLPNLLGIVLAKAHRREDIWSEIVLLRNRMEPVRDVLRKGRVSGAPDSEAFNQLMERLFNPGEWDSAVDTVIKHTSSVAASTSAGAGYGGVALKLASVAKPVGTMKRLSERLLHPEIHVLREFGNEVVQIQRRIGMIEKLWGQEIDRDWLATAARISQGSARETGRFRQGT